MTKNHQVHAFIIGTDHIDIAAHKMVTNIVGYLKDVVKEIQSKKKVRILVFDEGFDYQNEEAKLAVRKVGKIDDFVQNLQTKDDCDEPEKKKNKLEEETDKAKKEETLQEIQAFAHFYRRTDIGDIFKEILENYERNIVEDRLQLRKKDEKLPQSFLKAKFMQAVQKLEFSYEHLKLKHSTFFYGANTTVQLKSAMTLDILNYFCKENSIEIYTLEIETPRLIEIEEQLNQTFSRQYKNKEDEAERIGNMLQNFKKVVDEKLREGDEIIIAVCVVGMAHTATLDEYLLQNLDFNLGPNSEVKFTTSPIIIETSDYLSLNYGKNTAKKKFEDVGFGQSSLAKIANFRIQYSSNEFDELEIHPKIVNYVDNALKHCLDETKDQPEKVVKTPKNEKLQQNQQNSDEFCAIS